MQTKVSGIVLLGGCASEPRYEITLTNGTVFLLSVEDKDRYGIIVGDSALEFQGDDGYHSLITISVLMRHKADFKLQKNGDALIGRVVLGSLLRLGEAWPLPHRSRTLVGM